MLGFASVTDFQFQNTPHVKKSPFPAIQLLIGTQHRGSPGCSGHPAPTAPHGRSRLPSQNNVRLEEAGSHIALFSGTEKTGSSYLHRKDSGELPSGDKKENIFQKCRGFNGPQNCSWGVLPKLHYHGHIQVPSKAGHIKINYPWFKSQAYLLNRLMLLPFFLAYLQPRWLPCEISAAAAQGRCRL